MKKLSELKKENLLILLIFSLLITGMALKKLEPKRVAIHNIRDKDPHDTIEPSKDSSSTLVYLKRFKAFTMDERRIVFINRLSKG